jgi:cyclopropane fatty-acyl-phospholipid synthase-like methyltransferase
MNIGIGAKTSNTPSTALGEKLLDVGCGNGAFLLRAAEKAEVVGIDGSRFAQRHCQRLGLDVHLP